ncbi:MAG: magnesium transporter [Methanobacteriaceae archaeon]|nr:magnesium transporter [Methanobacteriaceae archaeon]
MNLEQLFMKIKKLIENILTILVKIVIILSKFTIKLFYTPFFAINKLSLFFFDVKRVLGESFIAIFISILGGLLAGLFLTLMTSQLETFPGLLVLIPGAIGMRGNIFGALGSRLNSNLHIGTLSPELKKSKILNQNIASTIILTIIMSILLAFMAKGFSILLGFQSMTIIDFTIISVLGGILSGIILLPATALISLKSYENGWDPDNVTTPLITTAGDIFTIPALFLASLTLLVIKNTHLDIILFIIFIMMGLAGFFFGIKAQPDLQKIIKQSIPTLFICSILGTTAGTILNSKLSVILDNPSILALVPLFSDQGGNLTSVLGARLSSGLHSGFIEAKLRPTEGAIRNFGIIIILAIILYPLIGLMAYIASFWLGIDSLGIYELIFISTGAGLFLAPLIISMTFFLSTASYRLGLDPDNIVIPISTSLTDPLATISLVLVFLFSLNIF